jgi:hypothetical protein
LIGDTGLLIAAWTHEKMPIQWWVLANMMNIIFRRYTQLCDGKVPIEFCETLTEDWLTRANELLTLQYSRIVTCARARGYEGFG